jgi:hypothetical protein
MRNKEAEFNFAMAELQSGHSKKLDSLTESLNSIVTRLAALTDEKLKLQLVTNNSNEY